MKRNIIVVAMLALLLGLMPIPRAIADGPCSAYANPPTYSNGTVRSWGQGKCTYTDFQVIGILTRNGQEVDSDGCGGYNTPCAVTPAAPNRSGNQTWCLEVTVYDLWSGARARSFACESQGF